VVHKSSARPPQTTKAKRRGRPRAYDPEIALDGLTEAFWKTGYSGTSLDALSDAADMNRPSLYAAFGDKQSAYLKALTRYLDRSDVGMRKVFSSSDYSVKEQLLKIYELALNIYFSGEDHPRGCFAIGTATTEAAEDPLIRKALIEGLRRLDDNFLARLRLARKQGEIDSDSDPEALAMIASATLHTMAIRARSGTSRAELEKIARKTVAVICDR
jgi:AcrR family transcriptional regulator